LAAGGRCGREFLVRRDPAADLGQVQLRQLAAELGADVGQPDVGREAGQPGLVQADPGAQRALAAGQLERIVEVILPGRQVGAAQFGVQLALPQRQVGDAGGEARMGEIGAQVERLAERGRRRGLQRHAVRVPAVQQRHVDVLERQFGRAALLVGPVQAAFADHDLALLEDPVGALAVARLRVVEHDAGHRQLAVGHAPHVEFGADDLERLEARLARRHAPPRHGGRHARQRQQLAALGVAQYHVAEEQIRPQAAPGRVDARDRDLVAERAAGQALDIALVVVDVRQDRITQHQEQHHEGEIHQQRQLDGEAEQVMARQVGETVSAPDAPPALGEREVLACSLLFGVVHQ